MGKENQGHQQSIHVVEYCTGAEKDEVPLTSVSME